MAKIEDRTKRPTAPWFQRKDMGKKARWNAHGSVFWAFYWHQSFKVCCIFLKSSFFLKTSACFKPLWNPSRISR